MLTQDDLKRIKQVVQEAVRPLDIRLDSAEREITSLNLTLGEVKDKVNKMAEDIADLKLETKAIHKIIANERNEFEVRIERLERKVELTS